MSAFSNNIEYGKFIENGRNLEKQCDLLINHNKFIQQEDDFEDNKGVIKSCNSKKDRPYNDQKKKDKSIQTIYKTLHRKLEIQQHEPH